MVCPYCLRELRSWKLEMICTKCNQSVDRTFVDRLLHTSLKCKKPGCDGSVEVKCHHCNKILPSDFCDYEKYLLFSIIGTPSSGKTSFLTAMLHELRNTPDIPWVLSSMDKRTGDVLKSNEEIMWNDRRSVEATSRGSVYPQFWRIRDKSRKTRTSIPAYSMTIFDGAGEDYEEFVPAIRRYISGSKELVILIDPLSLPVVRKSVSKDILSWSRSQLASSTDMIDGLMNYIRKSCEIAAGQLINKDVAVVFTKIDVLQDSFKNAIVMQSSPHLEQKCFVKSDADAVDAEIRDWLNRNGETAFLNAIETNFRTGKVRFFGVSSFGQPPVGDNQLGKIMPHRVLDPLMWMFSKEGIIPTIQK